jgi:two-component system sensor histidine kinase KdpD
VHFDFVLIEQVLVNLIENALKFSPADAPVEIRATLEQEVVQIQVLDRGAGIPPQDLERVFEKFYRAKQHGQTQGSGLGLMICRGIVQAHGGKVYAAPREGGGTRIVFTLPAAERVKVE